MTRIKLNDNQIKETMVIAIEGTIKLINIDYSVLVKYDNKNNYKFYDVK